MVVWELGETRRSTQSNDRYSQWRITSSKMKSRARPMVERARKDHVHLLLIGYYQSSIDKLWKK